ncbi:hypothetical protein SAGEFAYGE_143 [Bacillus phage SageFayge]|uniref:Uncharacterized protein n=1 Tax=Bacillus phage SageFayge TaxID=1805954 RepID=A0A143FPF1_9CAUD|nr:hypothetical protein SAGEFAYGE_143 [Bacillus phage SageFayge]AMW63063.1 hypothetical protein SAGEFAYGE_143 [Bacillus phage SageFayge]
MTEHKFTEVEAERVMKIVVGDKAGAFPMEDEILMTSILNDVLTKDTVNETKDVITKTEEILRRLHVALQEKKLANKVKEEVDKLVDAINTLYPEESRYYRVDAERKAGIKMAEFKVYKYGTLVNQFTKYLEVK